MAINKFAFLSILAVACLALRSHATTIQWGAEPGSRTIYDEAGITQVAPGSLVWAGTFANESFSLAPGTIADNVAAIQTAGGWSQFNPVETNTLAITNTPGSSKVGGQVTNNSAGATAFDGDSTYLWIFNAPTVGAATQMGIFRASDVGTTTTWYFPTNAFGVGDTRTLSTNSSGGAVAVVNAIGGVGSSATPGQLRLASVAPIPEPSTVAFGALGALAALCSRQRRRSGSKVS